MIFRLAQELSRGFRLGKLPVLPPDGNPFADWCVREFNAGRASYFMVSHTTTLYTAVFRADGISMQEDLVHACCWHIDELLTGKDLGCIYERKIRPATNHVSFSRIGNRSITGSMNELTKQAVYQLSDLKMEPRYVSRDLTEFLLSYLGRQCIPVKDYGTPVDAMHQLVRTHLSVVSCNS